jgi:hypothetical protein
VHGVAGGFFADVGALRGGEARDGFGDVDAADVGWGALSLLDVELVRWRAGNE